MLHNSCTIFRGSNHLIFLNENLKSIYEKNKENLKPVKSVYKYNKLEIKALIP